MKIISRTAERFQGNAKPRKLVGASVLSLFLLSGQTVSIFGNPTGGQVVAGSAGISSAGTTLTINQASNTAIINWQQFSINSGELTKFIVPNSSSATLNRVVGGNPSAIYGTLQSNGQLYLINPSGIVVGPNGRIDTAGFIGSTLDVSDDDFLKGGNLHFLGSSDASIDNAGVIHASSGDVYLIASQVNNSGTLSAPEGNVGLAAGTDVLFQQAGAQHLFINATPAGTTRATGVTNTGTILAASAELKAAGGNAYALAINNMGHIAATGFKKIKGQVYLTSDGGNITNSGQISANNADGSGGTIVLNGHGTSSAGTVLNSGTLAASGTTEGTTGGTVEVLGNRVGITDNGVVDVSGDAGGGTALIGGDEHGANPNIADADQTYLGPNAKITADAITSGNGGKIILWGNQTTQAYGQISARGGAQSGNGGFVETSAAQLDVQTVVDTSAANGVGGTWLLDPSDVTISDTASDSGFNTSPAFTITSGTVTISQSSLLTALTNNSTVTIDASTGSGGGGTITWTQSSSAFDITNANGHTLILDAPTQLTLNNVVISATGTGGLNLQINSSSSSGNVQILGSNISLNGGNLTAYGTGFASTTQSTNIGNSDGVDIYTSLINAGGGSITLNGTAGYYQNTYFGSTEISAGTGVNVGNSLVETSGSGNIGITGTGSVPGSVTSLTGLIGVNISDATLTGTALPSVITAVNGQISINGTVSSGTAGGEGYTAESTGVLVQNSSSVTTTGTTGSISIIGNTSGSTANANNTGVELINSAIVSVAGGTTGISINGTGGTVANTPVDSGTPNTTGISIESESSVTADGAAPIGLTGTGGTDTNDSSFQGHSRGINISNDVSVLPSFINPDSVVVAPSLTSITSASGNITLIGTGGTGSYSVGGIQLDASGGSTSILSATGNISLTGSVTTASTTANDLSGVSISGATVTAADGSIAMTGTVSAGSTLKEAGIVITSGAQVSASGTGGSGASAKGDVTLNGSTVGSTAQSLIGGVFVANAGTQVSATGTTADASGNTGLTIIGKSGALNGTTGTYLNDADTLYITPVTAGIGVIDGATLQATGTTTVTLTGTAGNNTNTDPTSASVGVAIFSPVPSETTGITGGTGLVSITGTAGTSPSAGIGVLVGGPANSGAVSITSSGAITIKGTGGSGGASAGTNTDGPLPNSGVAIFNPGNASGTIGIDAGGGDLTITGTAGGGNNSTGVDMAAFFGLGFNASAYDPILTTSGNLIITSTSGLVDASGIQGEVSGTTSVTAPTGTSSSVTVVGTFGTLSLSGGDFALDESVDTTQLGTVSVNNLTITANTNDVSLGTTTVNNLTIVSAGSITQTGALTALLITGTNAGSLTLTNTGNKISQLDNTISNGGVDIYTTSPLTIIGTVGSNGPITIQDIGNNLTLGPSALVVTTEGNINLVTDHYIINNSLLGAGVVDSTGGNYYLYSSDPTYTVLGGITVPVGNVFYSTTYPSELSVKGDAIFYQVASASDVGPYAPQSTPGGGSNTTSQITPQNNQIDPQLPPPPVGGTTYYTPPTNPSGGTTQTGGSTMAGSSGDSSTVGSNDNVEVGGGVNNMTNPQAAGALNQALSPLIRGNLADALKALGDFVSNDTGSHGESTASNDNNGARPGNETVLGSGEVAEMGSNGDVHQIPLSQAPKQLQVALNDDPSDLMKGH